MLLRSSDVASWHFATSETQRRHVGFEVKNGHNADIAEMSLMTDAVEKGFLAPEQRKVFSEQASIENIDSRTLDFGFYYCRFLAVERS